VACALLSAAAAYSPTAAIRLWELYPAVPRCPRLDKPTRGRRIGPQPNRRAAGAAGPCVKAPAPW
jgi:hypothetical protein